MYNVQSGSASTVFEPQSTGIGNWIYGFMYKDGELLYELNSSPNGKGEVLTYAFIEKVYSLEVLNGVLSYLCNGVLCSDYSDIVVFNGVTYLVKNGIVDTSENSIVSLGGNLYHVTNGCINTSESPALYRFDGSYYYFENGISSQKSLFYTLSGIKYYVCNGVVNEDGSSNWVTLNDRNYFVFNGRLYTGEISFNYNNQSFTSKKGIIAHDLRTDSAEKLTCLINIILGAEDTDYLYDFSRDENLNILDIVEAKKELANIG